MGRSGGGDGVQPEEYEGRKSDLIRDIQRVFSGVYRAGGVSLHEAEALDDYKDPDAARRKDKDRTWDEVPTDTIKNQGYALLFLDDIGFRYYLPAIMVWVLQNLDKDYAEDPTHYNVFDSLRNILSREEWTAKYCELLTDEERRVVARFILLIWERGLEVKQRDIADIVARGKAYEGKTGYEDDDWEPEMAQALNGYWGQFLQQPEPTAHGRTLSKSAQVKLARKRRR